jgi:hypothetical protein
MVLIGSRGGGRSARTGKQNNVGWESGREIVIRIQDNSKLNRRGYAKCLGPYSMTVARPQNYIDASRTIVMVAMLMYGYRCTLIEYEQAMVTHFQMAMAI